MKGLVDRVLAYSGPLFILGMLCVIGLVVALAISSDPHP